MKPPEYFHLIRKYVGKKSGYEVSNYQNQEDKKYYVSFNGHKPMIYTHYTSAIESYYHIAFDLIWRVESYGEPIGKLEVGKVLAHDQFEDLNLEIITLINGPHYEPQPGKPFAEPFATTIKSIPPGSKFAKIFPRCPWNMTKGLTTYSQMYEGAMEWHSVYSSTLRLRNNIIAISS